MSRGNGRPKLSEKGLLTPDNCVVAIIDLQPQMLFGVPNFDRQTVINNVLALAKATRVFDVPIVLTTVETKAFSGNIWPQVQAVFPGQTPIERSSMNSWDDENFVAAVKSTGGRRSWWPVSGPRPASHSPRCRRFTMATRCTWWRTAAAM